jgi:hypothetical protein
MVIFFPGCPCSLPEELQDPKDILGFVLMISHDYGVAAVRIPVKFRHFLNQAGPDRVEMDIPHQFQEVGILFGDDALIAILKEVPFAGVAAVMPNSVSSQQAAHDGGQRHRFRPQKDMHVIGHENPGKQPGPAIGHILRKPPEELFAVFVIAKDNGSLDSSGHHMVEQTGKIQPGSSGHGSILSDFSQGIKITFFSYQRPLRSVP